MHFILVLLILNLTILIHELGHFLVAKALGVQPKAFALGFGKTLWKKEKRGITYYLNILPLGGYVNFDMERFAVEKPQKRLAILGGGALFNFLFAVLFIALFVALFRYPLVYTPEQIPKAMPWGAYAFFSYIQQSVINTTSFMVTSILGLFSSPNITQIMGPVRIVTEGASFLKENLFFSIPLFIIINMNVLLINLFPFPALDGGRIILTLFEWVIGKRIPHEEKLHLAGFAVLMLLILIVIINDIKMVFLQ